MMKSIIEAIGNTPMVNLTRITRLLGLKGQLLAKLEYLNPGYSKKDRIAREMLYEAKIQKQLDEKQPVVELTSGNTGTGLQYVVGRWDIHL